MSTIASLLVNLGMNTAGFSGPAKKSLKDLDALAKGAMTLNAAMNIASAGASAIGRVLDSFSASAERIDVVAKLADTSGYDTASIVALQHGAKLAGVEVESLNAALTKMRFIRLKRTWSREVDRA